MRTSITHPIRIDEVRVPGCAGIIGLTFCPGKKDLPGDWDRDLTADLDAIAAWGAVCVVTLIWPHEFELLSVQQLGREVKARGMTWLHLPIRDGSIPDAQWEEHWQTAGAYLRKRLRNGERIVVHCRGGLGRAGTIAARLLVEFGTDPECAIAAVRAARHSTIETEEQERYILRCSACP